MQTDYDIDGQPGTATIEDPDITLVTPGSALAALNRSEIDMQISTAKAYPRSITAFKRTAMELATLDKATAQSMFYALPARGDGGKKIQGPSVRLAEVVAYAWGNVRAAARIISIDDRTVTAQGVCFDLERNVCGSVEVKRSIMSDKGKKRFGDDMIRVTCQAAIKIAYRESVFTVVPRALFKDVYEEAQLVSLGKGQSMEQLREQWLGHFEKKGVKRSMILKKLGVKGEDDLSTEDLITLAGIDTSLNDGELTLADAFADEEKVKPQSSPLNERVKNGGKVQQTEMGA